MALVTTLPNHAAADRAPRPGLSLMATLRLWRRRAQERTQLARFTDRELRDIGLSPSEAQREIEKPVWRP